jgi:hypothetical protein
MVAPSEVRVIFKGQRWASAFAILPRRIAAAAAAAFHPPVVVVGIFSLWLCWKEVVVREEGCQAGIASG